MEKTSMTSLICAYGRAYHYKNNETRIFSDHVADKLLTTQEYEMISEQMAKGIGFFNSDFEGTKEEALRWIVDNQLSPGPLGRQAFAETILENEVKIGAEQYVILGAGLDSFAYRQPEYAKNLQIFEVDHPLTSSEKINRVRKLGHYTNVNYIQADFCNDNWENGIVSNNNFDIRKKTVYSLLGLTHYLERFEFIRLLKKLKAISIEGSSIIFDYPDSNTYTEKASLRTKKQVALAGGANEKMKASYSYKDMETILSDCGFLCYEHLEPKEITERFFKKYNKVNPLKPMMAFDNDNYCLAVNK